MAGESEPRQVTGVKLLDKFLQSLKRVKDPQLNKEIKATVRTVLFLDLDQAPAKLHLHQLKNKSVASVVKQGQKVNVWTIHVTSDDRYKASFTLEDGTAYFRLVDEHDVIDKNP